MSRRRVAVVAVAVVVALLFGSWSGLLAALLATAAVASRRVSPNRVALAGALLFLVVPLLWLVGNHARIGEVSFNLVTAAPWPSRVTVVALVLVSFGVLFDVGGRAGLDTRPSGAARPPETVSSPGGSDDD